VNLSLTRGPHLGETLCLQRTNRPFFATRYVVNPARRAHILDGDRMGGGHRFGAGKGKSEFPQSWTDGDIINAIEHVANDSASMRRRGRAGRVIVIGTRNSISITVVVDVANADIATGLPA
jgi:hypothetical protein